MCTATLFLKPKNGNLAIGEQINKMRYILYNRILSGNRKQECKCNTNTKNGPHRHTKRKNPDIKDTYCMVLFIGYI